MDHAPAIRVAEKDNSGEYVNTTVVQVVGSESSTLTQTEGRGENKGTLPASTDGPVEIMPHCDAEREENVNSKRVVGKKMRQASEETAVRETATDSMDEYPPITTITDDEQELLRPPHVRKKKQHTDVDMLAERRDSRSTRHRRI
jgi:hypothetical protein